MQSGLNLSIRISREIFQDTTPCNHVTCIMFKAVKRSCRNRYSTCYLQEFLNGICRCSIFLVIYLEYRSPQSRSFAKFQFGERTGNRECAKGIVTSPLEEIGL